jgi:inhibitor of KinA
MPDFEFLSDQGILARCPEETAALGWAAAVRHAALPWVLDVVQAYTSVAVFVDPEFVSLHEALAILSRLKPLVDCAGVGRLYHIPCCYELGLDIERIAAHAGLSPDEVAAVHASVEYTVYAIGFSPGFPYLGYLPAALCGVPRLESPRLRVEPGSVGLTGRQTGIYPEARPGGWNLIGRTPLVLVDVAAGYFPLRTGDRIRFQPISRDEFARLQGRRLDS